MLSWPKARTAALERAKHKCEKCGATHSWSPSSPGPLHVHHKDENGRNHDLDNLQVLCHGCHGATHSKTAFWRKWGGPEDRAEHDRLGAECRSARQEARLTQYEVAIRAGINPDRMTYLERGDPEIARLAPAILAAIAQLRPSLRPCLACGCVECECEVSAWAESHPGNDPSEE